MEFRARGLDGPVEVLRDRAGVPHCWAVSEHDAFFAQGFVHAADRLWQMDYDRRRGLGRSAAVIGQNGDLQPRGGVRAAGSALTGQALAGIAREPWEPWHCLLVYRVRHLT